MSILKTKNALLLVIISIFLISCAPSTSSSVSTTQLAPWNGPIEGMALVMSEPSRNHRHLAEAVYTHTLIEFARDPYSRSRFDLVERNEIDLILQEYHLGSSGFVDTATAPRLGQLLGANYITIVSITSAQVEPVGFGGLELFGVSLGAGGTQLSLGLTFRMIDTTTGRIISASYGEARGLVPSSLAVSGFGVGSGVSEEAILQILPQAIQAGIADLFNNL